MSIFRFAHRRWFPSALRLSLPADEALAKAWPGVARIEIVPLPRLLGALLAAGLASELAKGAGHKYVRKVPTGKGGWRYFYAVTGGRGLGHSDEFAEGAKFKLTHNEQAGHFEVMHRDGSKVQIRHDETGHTEWVESKALTGMLHAEHADLLTAHTERTARDLAAAKKHGTATQVRRIEDHAGRYEHTKHLTGQAAAEEKKRARAAKARAEVAPPETPAFGGVTQEEARAAAAGEVSPPHVDAMAQKLIPGSDPKRAMRIVSRYGRVGTADAASEAREATIDKAREAAKGLRAIAHELPNGKMAVVWAPANTDANNSDRMREQERARAAASTKHYDSPEVALREIEKRVAEKRDVEAKRAAAHVETVREHAALSMATKTRRGTVKTDAGDVKGTIVGDGSLIVAKRGREYAVIHAKTGLTLPGRPRSEQFDAVPLAAPTVDQAVHAAAMVQRAGAVPASPGDATDAHRAAWKEAMGHLDTGIARESVALGKRLKAEKRAAKPAVPATRPERVAEAE